MRPRTWPGVISLRAARGLRGLAAFALCDQHEFADRLERRCGRAVHLELVSLPPGAPSGVCLRTAGADHLYVEEGTSAFHQAHILIGMAAHLLAESPQAGLDPRLAPGASPQLLIRFLGQPQGRPLSQDQAEALTFRAMRRAGGATCRASTARWLLRELAPLRVALMEAVPEAAARPRRPGRQDARMRLYRQVIEIRDAMLALRGYQQPQVASAAEAAGRAAGLQAEALAVSVEAAVLAAAIAAKQSGSPGLAEPGQVRQPAAADAGLRAEAAWLAKVSRSLAAR